MALRRSDSSIRRPKPFYQENLSAEGPPPSNPDGDWSRPDRAGAILNEVHKYACKPGGFFIAREGPAALTPPGIRTIMKDHEHPYFYRQGGLNRMKKKMTLREWLPLIGLTVSAFIFNTSEFIPIGLLTDIAQEFQMTEARAGLLITAYSWTVTLLSLPLMLLASRMDFRRLLLGTIALFGACQILSAAAPNYMVLMIARIGVACTHAVFWSIASPVAVRLVAREHQPFALSMIVTGTSLAMILGMPLGRIIGLSVGWRATFACVAAIALAVLLYMVFGLPRVPAEKRFSLRELPLLFRNRLLIGIYLLTFLIAASYYTGYSYIEPFLQQVAALSENWITFALILFGAAGILGSLLFSRFYDKRRYAFIRCVMVGIAASLLLLRMAALNAYTVILLCAFWGMAAMAFNVSFQSEVIRCVPESSSAVAMSIYSGIFNLGIGCGTWLGGEVTTRASISYIGYAGGILAVAGAAYAMLRLIRHMKLQETAA